MTRTRVLTMITGVAALAFSPLAWADDDPAKPTGGEKYGGSVQQPTGTTTEENLTPEEKEQQTAPATTPTYEQKPAHHESMGATGGDTYGAMGGSRYGVHAEPMEPMEVPPATQPEEVHVGPYTGIGVTLSVGGGVTDFISDEARDLTDTGGAWDARIAVGTHSIVGFEGAYTGSAQSIDALGLDNDAVLVGNGLEGLARVNFGTWMLQPYVVGGVGWTRYDITNEDFNNSDIDNSDDVVTLPLGVGFDTRLGGGFLLDVRGIYRPTFDENMFDAASIDGSTDMSIWSATARLGYEF